MAQPQNNLDELMKDPKAAGLLKNKELLKSIMASPDTKRLMDLLNRSAGGSLKTAAAAAAKGDPAALTGILNQVMRSEEGAKVVERISGAASK